MNMPLLLTAGGLGMITALLHGYLGEVRILRRVCGVSSYQHRILRAVFHLSTLYWFLGGLILVLLALGAIPGDARLFGHTVAAAYGIGAVANIWATRARHFGAPLLAAIALLAVLAV